MNVDTWTCVIPWLPQETLIFLSECSALLANITKGRRNVAKWKDLGLVNVIIHGDLDGVKYHTHSNTSIAPYKLTQAMSTACAYGHLPIVNYLFDRFCASTSFEHNNILSGAIYNNEIESVKVFVERSNDFDIFCQSLFLSVCHEKIEITKLLLQVCKNHLQLKPFSAALNRTLKAVLAQALTRAFSKERPDIVKVLIDAGAKITAKQSALSNGCRNGSISLVRHALEIGANPISRNRKCLRVALQRGHLNIARLLIQRDPKLH